MWWFQLVFTASRGLKYLLRHFFCEYFRLQDRIKHFYDTPTGSKIFLNFHSDQGKYLRKLPLNTWKYVLNLNIGVKILEYFGRTFQISTHIYILTTMKQMEPICIVNAESVLLTQSSIIHIWFYLWQSDLMLCKNLI